MDNQTIPTTLSDIDSPSVTGGQFSKKDLYFLMAYSAVASLFFVLFVWGLFDKGISALGVNATLCIFLLFGLFFKATPGRKLFVKDNLSWIIPLFLIALSFSLYDNPFLKSISFLVMPVAFMVFYNYAQMERKEEKVWGFHFFLALLSRAVSFFSRVPQSIGLFSKAVASKEKGAGVIIKKIIAGIALLLFISLAVVVPLLSSADPLFAAKIDGIVKALNNVISWIFVRKAIFFYVMSICLLAMSLTWSQPFEHSNSASTEKRIDSIISGIVLGGILCLYLLFLYLQLSRLWIHSLPIDFRETEGLVKSGFWQLFTLSIINILIFFFSFRKTHAIVQKILAVFTAASFLLLVSAVYRMVLYVTFYGLSYEKFFSSYTVLYCAILFIWIFSRFFKQDRPNIMKFLSFLFLWMYALISIFPIEQFILRSNMALAKKSDSRIVLYELTMLSPDVLGSVEKIRSEKESGCERGLNDVEKQGSENISEEIIIKNDKQDRNFCNWDKWIDVNRKVIANKEWYEFTVANAIYRLGLK